MQNKPVGIVKDEKIICPSCKVKYKLPASGSVSYPINLKCKKCFVRFIVYDPETVQTRDSSENNKIEQQKQHEKENLTVSKKKQNEQIKKFKVAKSNVIVSTVIAVPHVLAIILMPMHATTITASLLSILIWSSLASWIVWRFSGRKEKGGSLTFKIVLTVILLAKFAQYGINAYENQINNESTLSETSVKQTQQSNNMDTNSTTGTNSDEQKEEQIVKDLEAFVFDQIQSLGHQVNSVKLLYFVNIGPDHSVFILLYKTNDFAGAYFLCPEAERYVIYDTDDDMKTFKSMHEMNEEDVKNIIRDDFKRLADFEFPSE